mgnify:CR=1 FL=1
MGEENFQIIGADGTALFFCFRPPSLVLPPSPIAGVSAETPLRHRAPQKLRFCGGPENFIDFRQMNCRKSDAGTRRRGPRAICPAPRERRNAAGSRFFRRLRRFDQMGSPAQFTPGKGTMFLP